MTLHRGKGRGSRLRAQHQRLTRLASRNAPDDQPFVIYQLAIQLPGDTVGSRFSKDHPDLEIEIHNRMEVDPNHVLVEVRVAGPGAGDWADEVRRYPEVTQVEVREERPAVAQYRLTQATPVIHAVIRRQRILTRYPITLKAGWMRFETVATAPEIRRAVAELRRRVGPTNVEAVRRGRVSLGGLGLSPSQEAVFRMAIREGYYDVPRRASITALAKRLSKSKSTVSESLTRIEKRLADSALRFGLVPLSRTE